MKKPRTSQPDLHPYHRKIFEIFRDALQLCQAIIEECPCAAGCPSCVTALPPGVDDEALEALLVESNAAVACTRSLLTALLTGEVIDPEITFHELTAGPPVEPSPPDEEMLRLKKRMAQASKILQDKRARVH